jgi:hypothetical protein
MLKKTSSLIPLSLLLCLMLIGPAQAQEADQRPMFTVGKGGKQPIGYFQYKVSTYS